MLGGTGGSWAYGDPARSAGRQLSVSVFTADSSRICTHRPFACWEATTSRRDSHNSLMQHPEAPRRLPISRLLQMPAAAGLHQNGVYGQQQEQQHSTKTLQMQAGDRLQGQPPPLC